MRFLSSEIESLIPTGKRYRLQLTANADFPAVACHVNNWAGPYAPAVEVDTDAGAYGLILNTDWCGTQGTLKLQSAGADLCPMTGGATVTVTAGAVDACTANSPIVSIAVTGSPAAQTWVAGVAITPTSAPTATQTPALGQHVTWSVEPPLGEGMALDPATGVLTGTPRYASAVQTYVLRATSAGGSGYATFTATTQANRNTVTVAAITDKNWTHGVAITNVTPSAVSSNPAVTSFSWAISPALPTGVALNTTTGVISGTPTGTSPQTTYTLTATETGPGSTGASGTTTFKITVS